MITTADGWALPEPGDYFSDYDRASGQMCYGQILEIKESRFVSRGPTSATARYLCRVRLFPSNEVLERTFSGFATLHSENDTSFIDLMSASQWPRDIESYRLLSEQYYNARDSSK